MKLTTTMKTAALVLSFFAASVHAADWSDAYIAYSHGTAYREVANPNNVQKDIVSLVYLGLNSWGANFFVIDLLRSSGDNPARNGSHGAQEAYVVFQNTLSASKVTGKSFQFGPVRDVGLHTGFDFSSKNDEFGGAELKYMIGPKLEFDVPGYLSLAALALKDTGNNSIAGVQVNSKVTWRLAATWDFDAKLGTPVVFKGWATYTGARGRDGFGSATHPEIWLETALLWDLGAVMGNKPRKYLAGVGYQYIRNKFNNSSALDGTRTSTPNLRFEAHF